MESFSLIKNAGAKVFSIGKTTEQENAQKSEKLINAVNSWGLIVTDLSVEIDDDTVKVWRETTDLDTKEKIVLALGNKGISSVEDNLTIAKAEEEIEEVQFRRVKKGNTLSKIAKKYYENAMKYPVFFEANKPMLSHLYKIYPSQVLRIPALEN